MARRSDHTRDQLQTLILDKAYDIVGQEGFENLTARRLGSEIGYAPGTIYNIFTSMNALFLQVNSRTLDALTVVLNDPACHDPAVTPAQNMKTMAASYMQFATDFRPYWLMLFDSRLPEARALEDWYQTKIDSLFEPLGRLLRPFFCEGDETLTVATRVLWSSVHGLCFLQQTGKIHIVGDGKTPQDMAVFLIDTFIAGMSKRMEK